MLPEVSIVVPVYNGEKTLTDCLGSLMNLDYPRNRLEIIVVDNNSTDGTRDISKQYPVKYIFEPKRGRGITRNRGIKESKKGFIAFIDSDCVAHRNWLKGLMGGFTSPEIGGCGGRILALQPRTRLEWYFNVYYANNYRAITGSGCVVPFIITANAVYRRKVFDEVGLFDEFIIHSDDVDLSYRVFFRGYRFKYIREAIVWQKHRDRIIDYLKVNLIKGTDVSRLARKYGAALRSLSYLHSPWGMFFRTVKSFLRLGRVLHPWAHNWERFFAFFNLLESAALFLGASVARVGLKVRTKIEPWEPSPADRELLWWETEEEVRILNLKERGAYYTLSVEGGKVWRWLKQGKAEEEIGGLLMAEYGIGKERAREDVTGFIAQLKKRGLTPEFVSIIIPCFNQLDYTRQCLENIERYTAYPYELILIDNGSTDGTAHYLKSFSDVRLLSNVTNLGYAKATNQGIKIARGDHLCLLNNDVVVTKGWLGKLVECARSSASIGLVGPYTNEIGGDPSNPQNLPQARYENLQEMPEFARRFSQEHKGHRFKVKRLAGFCLLIKREVVGKIGLLDEGFRIPSTFEDYDYCLRAESAGYNSVCAGDVFVHHFAQQLLKEKNQEVLNWNKERFLQKWGKKGEEIWVGG